MKKLYATLLLCFACSTAVFAQEHHADENEALRQQVTDLTERLASTEKQALDQRIWKGRAKYFNIGYDVQKIGDLKADFGASLSWGKTYYLHSNAIWGLMKVGLDWSWLDIDVAQYNIPFYDEEADQWVEDGSLIHATVGMQLGPSVTINPIHHLKTSLYFRVTPSYAMTAGEDDFAGRYSTYCNLGLSVAWKVLSVGLEHRWGKARVSDYDGSFDAKVSSTRFYFGFRF